MLKYIKGQDLIELIDIEDFELVEYANKGIIEPHNKNGKRIYNIEIRKRYENTDEFRLYGLLSISKDALAIIGLASALGAMRGIKKNANQKGPVEEINELEKKGVKPASLDQILPEQYKDCIWESFCLPVSATKAQKIIDRFKGYLYLKSDVEKLKSYQPDDGFTISEDINLKWQDITITVLSEVEIHIQFKENGNGKNVTRRFDHLGFGDGRKGNDVPIKAWDELLKAAKEQRIPHLLENRYIIEQKVTKLRQKLKALFPCIDGDPVPHNKKDNSYHFAFHLNPPE